MRDVSGMNPGSRNRARGELIVHGPSVLILNSSAVSMRWVSMDQRRLTANCAFADYRTVLLKSHQKKRPGVPSVGRAMRCGSVPEMAAPGEHHGNAVLVARSDRLVVALRSAGLDDGGDPRGRGDVRPITKREEGVRSQHGPAGSIASLIHGDSHRVKAAHLPRAHAQ